MCAFVYDVLCVGMHDSHACICNLLYFSGPLIPRHVEVFRDNSFFKGISLPTPDKMVHHILCHLHTIMYEICISIQEPLEVKFGGYPMKAISFMKVR